jgi:hypothetical protein
MDVKYVEGRRRSARIIEMNGSILVSFHRRASRVLFLTCFVAWRRREVDGSSKDGARQIGDETDSGMSVQNGLIRDRSFSSSYIELWDGRGHGGSGV